MLIVYIGFQTTVIHAYDFYCSNFDVLFMSEHNFPYLLGADLALIGLIGSIRLNAPFCRLQQMPPPLNLKICVAKFKKVCYRL